MRRQRQRSGADKQAAQATAAGAARGFDHKPFRELARSNRKDQPAAAPVVAPPAPPAPQPVDDGDLFEREMTGVRPLAGTARSRVAPLPPAPPQRAVTDPDAEALAELSDLVAGDAPFDLANSVEFVEGAVAGLDRRLVRRLRAGDFAFQSHLDLHGMTAAEARVAVDDFLARAHRQGQRCVLIVHGRGLNSKDQVPVLKQRLTSWLSRGRWSRLVLAFTSARACDGGAGALYVLLRRQREGKRPIHVTQGAKW
jgi:DNA-nicking Smr family endonuclease